MHQTCGQQRYTVFIRGLKTRSVPVPFVTDPTSISEIYDHLISLQLVPLSPDGLYFTHGSRRVAWSDTAKSLGLGPLSHLDLRVVVPGGANSTGDESGPISYAQYTSPQPGSQFSAEYFAEMTVATADYIVKNDGLPTVLPKNSIVQWMFDENIPTNSVDINLAVGEFIPCLDDLLQITILWACLIPFNTIFRRSAL
ncbi:hypothetical protein C8R44DRAFT_883350 [Mycena epipterygia]|nr:hypothetical protein C8R44DRAFT_883350 [Mycena epipterygia]